MNRENKNLLTIIQKDQGYLGFWKEVWDYRELLLVLSWRDFKVRYKQTFFGVAWAILRPLITLFTFTFIFGRIAKLPSEDEMPYMILVLVALLPWQFFANSVSACSESLIGNESLISKVYFPRVLIPLSTIFTILIDFAFSLLMLSVFLVYYQISVSLRVLLIPAFLFLTFILAFGLGLFFSALNVRYRDIRYALPFVLQVGLFISPVGFSSRIIPFPWDKLYPINPMVGIIDGFRWCLSNNSFPTQPLAISLFVSLIVLIIGLKTFRLMERSFADVI